VPVDAAALERLAARLSDSTVAVVAVCFLHSYVTSRHEDRVADRLRRAGLVVCTSHEVLPEYREYERWSTTAVNAYVMPLVDGYLRRLERALGRSRLSVMQSNGGSISAEAARTHAVRTVLSGPAAGVIGARAAAGWAGFSRLISFDMGGTSTDVSLVDGDLAATTEAVVGDVPVAMPVIDIHTVGAGGGSIARVDRGGALVVGPESAGSVPGPACYGTGDEMTVTDANLLLGRLDPDGLLAGRLRLDAGRAWKVAADLARRMRLSVEDLAEGVVRSANAGMERAIRVVSLERGHDPRRFVLVAFGGAGGMHAAEIARELAIETVLVPRQAGVLSALGMLVADVTRDYSVTVLRPGAATTLATLERNVAPLVAHATRDLAADGFGARRRQIVRQIDVRYIGQSYEITVPWSGSYVETFHRAHERRYGYADRKRPIEVVTLRVRGVGLTAKPTPRRMKGRRRPAPVPSVVRPGRFGRRTFETAFHRWDRLEPGMHGRGPVVIPGGEATVVVPPGFGFVVDGFANIVIRGSR
jgi:N-methylhydantoinase A/oxoprolinase/acetone carboxylase beta subunit